MDPTSSPSDPSRGPSPADRLRAMLGALRDGVAGRAERIARVLVQVEAGRRAMRRLDAEVAALDTALTEVETHGRVLAGQAGDIADALVGLARDFDDLRGERQRLTAEVGEMATRLGEVSTTSRAMRLLSLTGAVEAARAGEAGQGFGMVAARMQDLGSACETNADRLIASAQDMHSTLVRMGRRGRTLSDELHMLPDAAAALRERGEAVAACCVAAQGDRTRIAARSTEMGEALDAGGRSLAELRRGGAAAAQEIERLAAVFGELLLMASGGRRAVEDHQDLEGGAPGDGAA